jgi:hypothetical protein
LAFGEMDELIDYGTFDPESVVVSFILCDAESPRQERSIIFNNLMRYCGLSSGILPSEKVCTVINFAEHYYNPGESVPDKLYDRYSNLKNNNSISIKKEQSPVSNSKPSDEGNFKMKRKNSANIYKQKENKYKHVREIIDIDTPNMSKSDNCIHEGDFDELPEGVDRIKYVEKKVRNKTTGLEEIIVKKTVCYMDGTSDSTIYKKK